MVVSLNLYLLLFNGLQIALWVFLILAAYIDIRKRVYPHSIAVCIAMLSILILIGGDSSPKVKIMYFISSIVTFLILVIFSGLFFYFTGEPGLGAGDIKCITTIALVYSWQSLFAYCLSCFPFVIVCLLARKHTLPALPFFVITLMFLLYVNSCG